MAGATLVTGVSKGIGRALADRLLAAGEAVIGLARTPPGAGYAGAFHAVDLADAAATAAVLAEITARHEIVRVVNNAGMIHVARLDAMTFEEFDAMVAVNLRAALQCAQACLPAMRRAGFGRIVNIGSRAALGKDGRGGYGATKAALIGFTRTWALELAGDGITVNCIAPGPVATEIFQANNPADSPTTRALLASIPVGRMGRPDEVAAAVAFLLSDEAGFITGQVLNVCGGLSVGLAPV